MNADEFKIILNRLRALKNDIAASVDRTNARTFDDMLVYLDEHQLEMEKTAAHAAKRDGAPTLVCVGNLTDRLDAIEKSLCGTDALAETHDEWFGNVWKRLDVLARVYVNQMKALGITVDLTTLEVSADTERAGGGTEWLRG